jgi:hypothetical protein
MSTDPENPELLESFSSDLEAAAVVTALRARGIEASTTGGFTAGFRAEAPGNVNVIVRHEDLDKARQALVEIRKERSTIDWSDVDVGDPES